MTTLVTLDPSIRAPGVAVFVDGVLKRAGGLTVPFDEETRAERCALAVATIMVWLHQESPFPAFGCEFACEWPVIYPVGSTGATARPNDLFGLAGVSAGVAVVLRASKVASYLPREWSCGTSKVLQHKQAHTSPRGRRVMGRLSPAERALVPFNHDAVDAIGIGLHHLGRFDPKRVLAGAV